MAHYPLDVYKQTRSVEQQVYVATTLLGRTQDQIILFLTRIWSAEKQTTEGTTAWMLSEIRVRAFKLNDSQQLV